MVLNALYLCFSRWFPALRTWGTLFSLKPVTRAKRLRCNSPGLPFSKVTLLAPVGPHSLAAAPSSRFLSPGGISSFASLPVDKSRVAEGRDSTRRSLTSI